ncbi:MAG: hypothetical protein ABSD11_12645 [Methylocella sp.]|jgi:hypothetical protein
MTNMYKIAFASLVAKRPLSTNDLPLPISAAFAIIPIVALISALANSSGAPAPLIDFQLLKLAP